MSQQNAVDGIDDTNCVSSNLRDLKKLASGCLLVASTAEV